MRRALLWAAALLGLALVAAGAVLGHGEALAREAVPLPSGASTGPRGLGAFRALVEGAGGAVARRGPGDDPAPGARTVVLAAPRATLSEADVAELLTRVEAGGLLLWALGPAPQPALERRLGLGTGTGAGSGAALSTGLSPHPLVGDLVLPASGPALTSSRPGALPASGRPGAATALSVPLGRGEALVLSGPDPLENAHLAEADAATLAVRLAARGPLVLDERFLGGSRAAPAARRALVAVALQLALAALVLLWARGRRLGTVRPPPAPAGRTGADYVASLAALYARAGEEPALAARTWRLFRRRLEASAAVPARLEDGEAARRLAARSPAAAQAVSRGAAALAAGGRGVLVEVARAAAEAERALRAPGRAGRG